MKKTFRTYKSLRFTYDKANDDDYNGLNEFEQRKLIIKHFESKLHMIFSYKFVTEFIAYFLLFVSAYVIIYTTLNLYLMLIPLSLIIFFISILLNNKYINNVRYYKMSISIMNDIIFNKYNTILDDEIQ